LPQIVGIGDGFNVIVSDIPTLLDRTKRVIAMRDGERGYITPREVYIETSGALHKIQE